jgi:transcriptional regulator with XRE-family HTH domain
MQGSLAERLRVLRARHGLSLTEASEELGVNRHTLRDLELGKREPYGPTLRKIAVGYNVPMAWLLEEPAPLAEASGTGLEELEDALKQARALAQQALEEYGADPASLKDPQKRARAAEALEALKGLEERRGELGAAPPEPFALITERLGRPTEIRFLRVPSPEERARVMEEHPDAVVVEAEENAIVEKVYAYS